MEYTRLNLVKKATVSGLDVDEARLISLNESRIVMMSNNVIIGFTATSNHEFKGKSMYLDENFDWVVGKASNGDKILVPLIKER